MPSIYDAPPLNGPDHAAMPSRSRPGAPLPDAPLPQGWLLDQLGPGFTLLAIDTGTPATVAAQGLSATTLSLAAKTNDAIRTHLLRDAQFAVYLIRLDQHVAARWLSYDETAVAHAIGKAIGKGQ